MAINFPNSPSPNQQYTYDNKTWEWNGTYWEVYSALTSYITSAYTVGNGYSDISGVTGGNIVLKSFSGININIIDGGDTLTFSGSSGNITGGGTSNYLPKWTGSTGLGNSLIYDDGTNVGIGTSLPSARLDVNGDTLLRSGVTLSNLSSSANTRFIVSDSNGNLSYRTDVLTGTTITISGGTGITTGGTYPNFTITNSSPDQTVTISGGADISVTGTYPDFTIDFIGTTGGGPTLVASNTCVIPADGNPYIGSSSVGWGYFQWDTQYEDPIRQRNVTNGIPLPKDVNKNDIIRVCGIAYCDASVPENDTLGVISSYFICGDLRVNLISQNGYTYERDGTVCFNLEATYTGRDTLVSCETFLILGFSSSLSDASQIKISYTIKIE